MNKYILMGAAMLLAAANMTAANKKTEKTAAQLAREEILANPNKSGGVYYAYPFTTDSLVKPPLGYKPVYISHYGRHGSRWVIGSTTHSRLLKWFKPQHKAGNLTPEGERVYKIVQRSAKLTDGHEGELTQLGVAQHKGIAGRMIARFPELFRSGDTIVARSSTAPRCIISMSSFLEGLKQANPGLVIDMDASQKDMAYIMYHTKVARDLENRKTAEFDKYFAPLCDSLMSSRDTFAKLFVDTAKVHFSPKLMQYLHDVASDFQDVDYENEDLLSVFTPQDLVDQWKQKTLVFYARHAMSPATNYEGAMCAKSLLRNIIDEADRGLKSGAKVNLRFGHDTALIRLLAFMGAGNNISLRSTNPEEICDKWHVQDIAPMAGNLQLIFFRNAYGEVLVTARLNEQPLKLENVSHFPGHPYYYKWDTLRRHWDQLTK